MAIYPAYVWDGSTWQQVGTQGANMDLYALKDGSNFPGWQAYTPTFGWGGNSFTWSVGGAYSMHNKTCDFYAYANITGGSAGSASGSLTLTLPVAAAEGAALVSINAKFLDAGVQWYDAALALSSTTMAVVSFISTNGSLPGANATLPFTWAVNDGVYVGGTYRTA